MSVFDIAKNNESAAAMLRFFLKLTVHGCFPTIS
jgi:hypothetical protein